MGTTPMKSQQPLHNFSLPFLKWGQRNILTSTNNPRYRRLSAANASPPRRFSESDSDSDSQNYHNPINPPPPPPSQRNRVSIPKREKDIVLERDRNEGEVEGPGDVAKAWNLRPRKGVNEVVVVVERGSGGGTAVPAVTKSGRLRGGGGMMMMMTGEKVGTERRENTKLWISLSKEEIEEDLYALTGSKPTRRPKKRPKSVQKQLDNLFPGLYMVGFTADTYRVHEALK